jgi:hypothetical protein
MYDQDPIAIPYVIDVTPCRLSTFAVPANPGDIVLDRTVSEGLAQHPLVPVYHDLF